MKNVKDDYIGYIKIIVLLIEVKKSYKQAFKYTQELLKYSENNSEAIFYQAYCLLSLNQYKKSISLFQKLLSHDLKNNFQLKEEIIYKTNFGIGLGYLKLKDKENSLKYFQTAKNIINTNEVSKYISDINTGVYI